MCYPHFFIVSPGCLAAGPVSPAAVAPGVHIPPPKRSADHGPGAPDPALHGDRIDRAVPGTGPALHAGRRADQFRVLRPFGKDPMRADLRAAFAVDAPFGIIAKGIFPVRIEHTSSGRFRQDLHPVPGMPPF